jgi:peptidoglycan/xylan/chitin deacetylase (PgdA/CDA1 family)
MRRLTFPLALGLSLALAAPALGATDYENPSAEALGASEDFCAQASSTSGPSGWVTSCWGNTEADMRAFSFTHAPDGHDSARSLKVSVSNYKTGDGKWIPSEGIQVQGGDYYTFSDYYKATADTGVSLFYQTAAEVTACTADPESAACEGHWLNLDTGIAPAAEWTKFTTGILMPADAARAYFTHFIAGNGTLQTDDYAMGVATTPPGLERPLVTLTFDDSTPNLYDDVLPMLDAAGIKSTQYVVTGATGQFEDANGNGVRDAGEPLYQWTVEQVADVHRRGHEIGSHTIYHPNLTMPKDEVLGGWIDPFTGADWYEPATLGTANQKLADTTLAQELGDSKAKLEELTGFEVSNIAYPFGAYDTRVVQGDKAAGYRAARAVDEGFNSKVGLDKFKIRVQNVAQAVCTNKTTGKVTVANRSAGVDKPKCPANATMSTDVTTDTFKSWVKTAKDNNFWLVLVYHPVDDLGVNPYGTSVARFQEQLAALKASGIPIKTMREALNEVMPQIEGDAWTPVPVPDVKAPETRITAGPSGETEDATPTFSFSATGAASFQCRIDASAWSACSSPYTPSSALTLGAHSFDVRAKDAAGNEEATMASRSFVVVDKTGPQITISSTSEAADPTPTFTFAADEAIAAFECRLDGGSWAACPSPHTTGALAARQHTIEVRAKDASGNLGTATRAFTVADARGPVITITSSSPADDTTPTFEFASDENTTFECRLDGETAFAPCAATYTTVALAPGAHRLDVRGTDAAGNRTVAEHRFAIAPPADTSAPETEIDASPGDATTDKTPTFGFSADEPGSAFECSLDAGAWIPCASPHRTSQLGDGSHTFMVRAVDAAGNADPTPASRTFTVYTQTVDVGAPVVDRPTVPAPPTVPNPPAGAKDRSKPKVRISSPTRRSYKRGQTVRARYACSDDVKLRSCTGTVRSGARLSTRTPGLKTFKVTAKDASGNTTTLRVTYRITR